MDLAPEYAEFGAQFLEIFEEAIQIAGYELVVLGVINGLLPGVGGGGWGRGWGRCGPIWRMWIWSCASGRRGRMHVFVPISSFLRRQVGPSAAMGDSQIC